MVTLTTRSCLTDIQFRDISFAVNFKKGEKKILDNVSGQMEHGRFHAIMGPSGAGKSSLLNVLAGLNDVASGEIVLNGNNRYSPKSWAKIIGPLRSYVMQDDYLVPELTVKETLNFASVMNRITTPHSRNKLVRYVLDHLAMLQFNKRTISALSGGQRKRISVANEMVNFKPVMFLDEPTTGLDSGSTYKLVEFLKHVCNGGCNVIAVIHQPSSRVFQMFDTLTVLGVGGRMAFSGPPLALLKTIEKLIGIIAPENCNPADFLFSLDERRPYGILGNRLGEPIANDTRETIIELMAQATRKERDRALFEALQPTFQSYVKYNIVNETTETVTALQILQKFQKPKIRNRRFKGRCSALEAKDICQSGQPSSMNRFGSLLRRTAVQAKRNPVFFVGRFIAYIMATLVIGLVFEGVGKDAGTVPNNVAFVFLMTKIFLLGSCIVTIMSCPDHLKTLVRENLNRWYGISAFFWSRTLIEAFLNIVTGIIFSMVMWFMTKQVQSSLYAVPLVILVICLHTLTSYHFSFVLAMFVDEQALPQLPFAVAMLHVLFGGYFVPLNELPNWLIWAKYIDFGTFTFKAIMKIVYAPASLDTEGEDVIIPCDSNSPICPLFNNGTTVLDTWGINDDFKPLWMDVVVLAVWLLVLMALHWILLKLYLERARKIIARI